MIKHKGAEYHMRPDAKENAQGDKDRCYMWTMNGDVTFSEELMRIYVPKNL